MADEQMTEEPHDRLTRLCAIARDAVTADPEWNEQTDKLFVSMDDGDNAAMYSHGYDGPWQLVKVLLSHVHALSRVIPKMN